MTKIGQLTTEKSIELAVKEIKEWLSMIEVNGLDVDIRYDAKTNVAMLRFKYGGREYEFVSRKQKNCRLNMWGIARVMEFKVRAQVMGIENLADSMYKYRIEGKVEEGVKQTDVNETNYVRLGISPLASTEEIQKKYLMLMKSFHPDMALSKLAKDEFDKRTAEINRAYSEIKKERGIK